MVDFTDPSISGGPDPTQVSFAYIPLLHNLALLAALPETLRVYTGLSAIKRGSESFQAEDFYTALDIVEMKITAYARHDRIAQSFVQWHLELYQQQVGGEIV